MRVTETISTENELLTKLTAISEDKILEFMKNLHGGTYFHMGMYSSIPISKQYKNNLRLYKVIEMSSIVSGVSYENIGTTKEFRQETGTPASSAWYDHLKGFENKVGVKKTDPNSKYVLWDVKPSSGTNVRYYLVDFINNSIQAVSKDSVLNSVYLTASEKAKMTPQPVTGFNLTTGQLVENKTVWRTAAFEHIFWLYQEGKATSEVGIKFEESYKLSEDLSDIFIDANYNAASLDSILEDKLEEKLFIDFE